MKYKEFNFDVEIIIDHKVKFMNKIETISTHHMKRGIKLKDLYEEIQLNLIPYDKDINVTLNIRGVNY